jgi:hypothetical protein
MSEVTWDQPHSPTERRYCSVRCIGNAERYQQVNKKGNRDKKREGNNERNEEQRKEEKKRTKKTLK